tara:strand:+ start:622 stop:765 length:144 start_codon:yes stop_codon:yes gene_type:complete
MQLGYVSESFEEIDKSVEMIGYELQTNVNVEIRKFVKWYKEYNNLTL